tara:strand:+ start:1788 stop:1937 length:150 start_codon:yes stop_codon:yes gene_type:complete
MTEESKVKDRIPPDWNDHEAWEDYKKLIYEDEKEEEDGTEENDRERTSD